MELLHDRLMQIALRRNILFPSADLYGPIGGFFDYGPVGAAIKHRIENLWRRFFVQRNGFVEIETSLILPEPVVKASGHIDHFTDPVVTCRACKSKFRADYILEENGIKTAGKSIDELNALIKEQGVMCPSCGGDLSEVSFFNLMFKTNIGPIEGTPGYTRPETAQGIFLAFPRIYKAANKLPLGIAQIGRSFRNELSPRQSIIRLREFTQAELEYFFDPDNPSFPAFETIKEKEIPILMVEDQLKGKEATVMTCGEALESGAAPNEIFAYFLGLTADFYEAVGILPERMRFRQLPPEERAHYSGGTFDLEVETSFGWIETVSLAYRTDYDLRAHSQLSGKDLSIVAQDGRRFIPHVVEPSFGIDRLLWCVLEHTYRKSNAARDWEWLDLPPAISPYDAAVFPLMKKDGLAEKAQEITAFLRQKFDILYDESASIGKRYARADEIGVFLAITVDYDTLKDDTVTIRNRNTTDQERVRISDLPAKISALSGI